MATMATTKLNLAVALLLALVAVATATSYTTTVTTTTFEDDAKYHEQQQCQRQLKGRYFRSCQRYLAEKSGAYAEDEEVIENPGQQQPPQHLEECCQQLQKVSEQCRCEAIKSAMKQMQQQKGQTTPQVYERAAELPGKCNMRPQQCQVRVVFV